MSTRPEESIAVLNFGEDMKRRLIANSHKPHWSTVTLEELWDGLTDERDELDQALWDYADGLGCGSAQDVIDECADVANFAMFIADNLRTRGGKEDD